MLTAEEVAVMPEPELLRQLLVRADRIDQRLDKLDDSLGGDAGIRVQLAAIRLDSAALAKWSVEHERKDDERHREIAATVAKLADEVDDDSEEDRKERRRAWSTVVDPRILIPLVMSLGAAAAGYSGGAYYPPAEIVEMTHAAPAAPTPTPSPTVEPMP